MALVGLMTEMAQGKIEGRHAFGLPTGYGKTSAIIAWVSTLFGEGGPKHNLSISVAASKVEALCELHRELVSAGVPDELIGLVHSYKGMDDWKPGMSIPEGHASIAATPANEDRPIVLVTHNKIRGDTGLDRFIIHRGKKRDLMLYDESLIVSDSTGINVPLLRGSLGWLREVKGNSDRYADVIDYLSSALAKIQDELDWQTRSGGRSGVISLPSLSDAQAQAYAGLVPLHSVMEPASVLLSLHKEPLRVVSTGQGGLVHYDVSVPRELRNILILDASYPIRALVQLDPTIKDAEQSIPAVKRIGVPLSRLKSFENVTIHQLFSGGGRTTLSADYQRPDTERCATRAIVDVVKTIPPTEAVLIFTYKKRPGEKIDFKAILTTDLRRAGVDVGATLADGSPRINIVTWGMETSLNSYAHCSTVILAGVLQRSPIDLAANFIGQSDDLRKAIPANVVSDLNLSEVSHMVYQALSRGSCRVVENGKAKRMTAYIIHLNPAIRGMLDNVMPKANWQTWISQYHLVSRSKGRAAIIATSIVDCLHTLPETQTKVATTALRHFIGIDVHTDIYKAAIKLVPRMCAWEHQGRSLVRLFPT